MGSSEVYYRVSWIPYGTITREMSPRCEVNTFFYPPTPGHYEVVQVSSPTEKRQLSYSAFYNLIFLVKENQVLYFTEREARLITKDDAERIKINLEIKEYFSGTET